MFDYGSEGFSFFCDDGKKPAEFGSVGAAVKHAMELRYSTPFIIVQVVDWEALEIKMK